jgi:hypothetical protein
MNPVTYQGDDEFDEDGEDQAGRELVAARLAAEGKFLIFELSGSYLAVAVHAEMYSDITVKALMAALNIDFEVPPVEISTFRADD